MAATPKGSSVPRGGHQTISRNRHKTKNNSRSGQLIAENEKPVAKRTQLHQLFGLAHSVIVGILPKRVMSASVLRDCRNSSRTRRRSAFLSRVKRPCLSAFLFPRGAPDPGAPPCIRQRLFPLTAGDRQNPPRLFRAPQRGLASIGSVLRL